jgi:hypothetical protein
MSQPTARDIFEAKTCTCTCTCTEPVPVPVPILVPVHSICPRPIISLEIQDINESDHLLERYHDTWQYGKNAPNMLSILRPKIWRSHKPRFQNKNVECTITTVESSFSGFIAYRWKYHRGEGQYDRKRGAHAVVYLPMCG